MDMYMMALDQGTTSSRAIIFDREGGIVAVAQQEFPQIFPRPGWVEHDPMDIWNSQLQVARTVIKKARITPDRIAGTGITNQRETTIIWERETGKPVTNAIVWQCRRTSEICAGLEAEGHDRIFREKTGLLLDPYFSGTKVKWILQRHHELWDRACKGELCFGTVDSWLLFNLTGVHATEPSNASRTLMYNIHTGEWDDELLRLLDVPKELLPEIKPSCGEFGKTKKELLGAEIPVCGILGDQQAALFGQACFDPGDTKNTYGTGCFALTNTGRKPKVSENRLLTTVAWDLGDGLEYALEGSVFIGGAVVQWLRDKMGLVKESGDSEALAESVEDTGGVYLVPAFTGLGAPYWDPDARGTIVGITRGTASAHIVRAALESIAFQSRDLITAIEEDIGSKIASLKVDGGATANSFLMQFQSDILGIPLTIPEVAETTALGAASIAGLHCAMWDNKAAIKESRTIAKRYEPEIDSIAREEMVNCWHQAVDTSRTFKPQA